MRTTPLVLALGLLVVTTTHAGGAASAPLAPAAPTPAAAPSVSDVTAALIAKFGKAQTARITQGVKQVAALWRSSDGDLKAFCLEHFIADDAVRAQTFVRFEGMFEQLFGHMNEVTRALRTPTDLDVGPLLPVDPLFAAFDPAAHVTDDLFDTKLAFVVLLNFPVQSASDKLTKSAGWSRDTWAQARLTDAVSRRVPAEVQRTIADVAAQADLYIAEYNLYMHHVLDEKGARVFPKGKRLISHWNLRDELKAQYPNGAEGTNRQRVIVKLMERIVAQTIPALAINNPTVDYNPFTNTVVMAPADTWEEADGNAARAAQPVVATSEIEARGAQSRYGMLKAQFDAQRAVDPYSLQANTAIARSFEVERQMPEARVKALFESVLRSPLVPRVAAEIKRRLGRPLEPQDLWFDGFKARSAMPEATLDAKTRARYPNAAAYHADMPRMLVDLGFTKQRADYLASQIVVDPARGAGHAMQAERRGDFPHLRTRIEPGGMDYKGYNIAVHEMGHNVEQVFSLYGVDHTLLQGVPNNAFTEAIAFVFQARDLELLGVSTAALKTDTDRQKNEIVLADFWDTWEIAGVALVDVGVWHWLYAHPDATPQALRDATVAVAADVWKTYYQPVLGSTGAQATPLLGIYSHMIAYPLYLSDYPLGHMIAFQIEEALNQAQAQGKSFGSELERITVTGNVAPDLWMKRAAGSEVSAAPLLRATERALGALPKQ